jgi:hypothetical protein
MIGFYNPGTNSKVCYVTEVGVVAPVNATTVHEFWVVRNSGTTMTGVASVPVPHDTADAASVCSGYQAAVSGAPTTVLDVIHTAPGASGPVTPIVRVYAWNPIVIRSGYGCYIHQASGGTSPIPLHMRWYEK